MKVNEMTPCVDVANIIHTNVNIVHTIVTLIDTLYHSTYLIVYLLDY